MVKSTTYRTRKWWAIDPPGSLYPTKRGDVICCDALECLKALRRESADLIFIDPPFNLGKQYGQKGEITDCLADDRYSLYILAILEQSCGILKPGGALYLYHIPKWAVRFASALDSKLLFRHWIAISMKPGFVRGNYLYPAHYALLYFTKGDPLTFHRPKIPPPRCRKCGNYVRDYGGYTRYVRNGINITDVWDDFSPVRHRKYKHRHANELPLAMLRRILGISGRPRGLLVDPFAGTGISVVAALEATMNYIVCDKDPESCKIISSRIANLRP